MHIVCILFLVYTTFVYAQNITFLSINNDTLAFVTDPLYLSYVIDAKVLPNWKSDALIHDTRFNTLMRAISPAWVRIGGTQGDHMTFKEGDTNNRFEDNTFSSKTFQDFCILVQNFRLNLTFGLNLLLREGNLWNPTNAEVLMNYILKLGGKCRVHFELGNEPDLYFAQGYAVNESQIVTDFTLARKTIDKVNFTQRSFLWGPDVASPLYSGYFLNVLKSMPPTGVLDGVTYHHFYDQADIADPVYSYDPLVLDKFLDRATQAADWTQTYQKNTTLILGSVADYTGDGAGGISDTFLQGFMYLDSLGIAAYLKHSIYFKNSLFGTKYSSLLELTPDRSTVNPTPAYWITLLYRRLVGSKVLSVTGSTSRERKVRIYAHCQNGTKNGSVVIYLMNLAVSGQEIEIRNDPMKVSPQYWYLLSSPDPDLSSKVILLNGDILSLTNNTILPELTPDIKPASNLIKLPARQYGFIVFPSANVKPCKVSK
ncbi:Heparanase-like [Oopsacas minuta]|uniref:Heparanase-like n=1 Tax=Oopsacas minuta TaxID=111878 RepID=A0AAV7K7W6_9METZ|nr:Heparanase-like [Oopsacas minuta]